MPSCVIYWIFMKVVSDSSLEPRWRSFYRFLLARAFWILVGFTLLFLICIPPVESHPHYPPQTFLRADMVLATGVFTWIYMLIISVRAFLIPAERPSVITAFFFFLIFGIEILCVAGRIL
jgi:hypothetical protein